MLVKTVVTSGAWRLFLRFTDDERPPAGRGDEPPRAAPVTPARQGCRPGPPEEVGGEPPQAPRAGRPPARPRRAAAGDARQRGRLAGLRPLAGAVPGHRPGGQGDRARARPGRGAGPAPGRCCCWASWRSRRRIAGRRWSGPPPAPEAAACGPWRWPGLGELARANRRESAGLELLRAALAADPGCVPAVLALASEEQLAGLTAAALARLDALPRSLRATGGGPAGAGAGAGGAGAAGGRGRRAGRPLRRPPERRRAGPGPGPRRPAARRTPGGPSPCTARWPGSGRSWRSS